MPIYAWADPYSGPFQYQTEGFSIRFITDIGLTFIAVSDIWKIAYVKVSLRLIPPHYWQDSR